MKSLQEYEKMAVERQAAGIPPLPLRASEVQAVIELLPSCHGQERDGLLYLLRERVNPGVDDGAKIKADFLARVVNGRITDVGIEPVQAVAWLGEMRGGYNISPLLEAMDDKRMEVADAAILSLENTLLIYDAFADVVDKFTAGHARARKLLESWAAGEWFKQRAALPEELVLTVFKVPGETNTDDLSPASEASSRSDIPLHAQAMLAARLENPLAELARLRAKGYPIAYVGDVVGTGSSRKSAINSIQWHFGNDLPGVPNKRGGGVVICP